LCRPQITSTLPRIPPHEEGVSRSSRTWRRGAVAATARWRF
jgi:hypothetical protein